jgi:hypothetical protein
MSGSWQWTWVERREHYPIDLVDDTDEISGDEQLVLLWIPRGSSTEQAIEDMEGAL